MRGHIVQWQKIQEQINHLKNQSEVHSMGRFVASRPNSREFAHPLLEGLKQQRADLQLHMREENLKRLYYQIAVGPVVSVASLFRAQTENVSNAFIFLLVLIFNPLALSMMLTTIFILRSSHDPASSTA